MKIAGRTAVNQGNEAPSWFQLFSVQYVHPAQCFSLAYLSQIHLRGFEILVPEYHLGDDFKGNPIPARVRS